MTRKRSAGYILVQALVAIAGLLALMAILAADEHASLSTTERTLCRQRAQFAEDAGIARALAVLSSATPNVVQQTDDWYKLGNSGDDVFAFDDGSTFRLQIVDAASLINLNTAQQAQLMTLPLDQDQVDCLLDWRSAGTTPRSDGAKDDYYNALDQPYNAKLGNLDTVDELLLVKNWTAETIYQTPPIQPTTDQYPTDANGVSLPLAALLTVDSGAPNTTASGGARINVSTRSISAASLIRAGVTSASAYRIVARAPFRTFEALLIVPGLSTADKRALLNNVKFTASTARVTGKYNLNTVTEGVLLTLPTVQQDIAGSIVEQQSSGFSTLGALTTVNGVSSAALARIADLFSVGSDTWIARVYGECGTYGVACEAVIRYQNQKVQVVNLTRLNTSGVPAWWGWDAQPTANLQAGDLGEQSQ
ncbi:MAG: type II secretion system protein GspK [Capsulimonadaceae bacterium]|nr:type II secretion system protein GspK [Capsulimonadaceae bacterium]